MPKNGYEESIYGGQIPDVDRIEGDRGPLIRRQCFRRRILILFDAFSHVGRLEKYMRLQNDALE